MARLSWSILDQWIRGDISREQMAGMKPGFKPDGLLTAATSSPLTIGAAAVILMERSKADNMGLSYHLKYEGGAMAGCDPTIMGIGPIHAVKRLLYRKNMKVSDIDLWEFNEAFASQTLACVRDLGIAQNAPFENVNVWGGALALGHPLGESGCRLVVTMNNIMKTTIPKPSTLLLRSWRFRQRQCYNVQQSVSCDNFSSLLRLLIKRIKGVLSNKKAPFFDALFLLPALFLYASSFFTD